MKKLDLSYLCSTIGSLCGFPVRLYEGNELVFKVDHSGLKYDPIQASLKDLFALSDHIGTYITPRYYYYGVVRSGETRLILGPTRQLPATEQQLRELAFLSNVPSEEMHAFIQTMRSLIYMPLESLQQILCTMNYVMNGEKLSLEDIVLRGSAETQITPNPAEANDGQAIPEEIHNTLAIEQTLMNILEGYRTTYAVSAQFQWELCYYLWCYPTFHWLSGTILLHHQDDELMIRSDIIQRFRHKHPDSMLFKYIDAIHSFRRDLLNIVQAEDLPKLCEEIKEWNLQDNFADQEVADFFEPLMPLA